MKQYRERDGAIRALRLIGLTLQTIGDVYGVSETRIRQICDDIPNISSIRSKIDARILPVIKKERVAYDAVELFHSLYVRKGDDACWNWMGYIHPVSGYGIQTQGQKNAFAGVGRGAHRRAWYLATGTKPPKGRRFHIMHTCDNARCVNPAHLVLGTSRANHSDAVKKGRKKPGERKICTKDVEWIKNHYKSTADLPAFVKKYGISSEYAYRIALGRAR